MIASPDGSSGSLTVAQDARVYATLLPAGESLEHALPEGRHAWIQVARGNGHVGPESLSARDGAAVSGESSLRLTASDDLELLLFDLA